ncbi:MAG: PAS domain-containing protein, partial [Methanomicrobiales archaeon]|nr:PAS domain-containing protein [Methanomicrobiales archaeon]
AMELVDMPPEQDIHQYIADRLSELIPRTLIQVVSHDEVQQQFAVQAIRDREIRDALTQILGIDPVGLAYPMTDIFSHPSGGGALTIRDWGMRKYTFWPEIGPEGMSLYEICFRQIPEELCDEICRTLPIGKAYFVFLVWGEQLFGNVGIFLPPDRELEDTQVVESFLRQASIALARRQTAERLRRSERRFTEVMDASPVPAALLDPGGRHLYLNRAFTERFGYTLADIPTGRDWFEKAFPDPDRRQEAIAVWKADLGQASTGPLPPRTCRVRCRDGAEKTVHCHPVRLSDGNQYVTYDEIAAEAIH